MCLDPEYSEMIVRQFLAMMQEQSKRPGPSDIECGDLLKLASKSAVQRMDDLRLKTTQY